ncbi:DUF2306 domain-containing protein [Marinobacter zhanjiangensis]|uniref:Membrane protein n=1 Tax=Marinobacter zhanjiangensis TaxID=578215 RepID=A0ABQ3B1G3_9GAMM|nr:DUF2306 domain-containing protein [Marinobacter zhanjiangensis]GGY74924.1 membrane protein [Marinobacter zhanjiangensis]
MNLNALLAASLPIQIHVVTVMLALVIGLLQLVLKRGTSLHRTMGWGWVVAMAVTAVSSFFIHRIQLVGPWSPIHILSVVTLVYLTLAIQAARQGNMRRHGMIMASLFLFAVIGAGVFTLLPGRLMHVVLFGQVGE